MSTRQKHQVVFRISVIILIQLFLLMDCFWIMKGVLTDNAQKEQVGTLSPDLNIGNHRFQNAFHNYHIKATIGQTNLDASVSFVLKELDSYMKIGDKKLIKELEKILRLSTNPRDKERVARKIMGEVVGNEYEQLRLKAFKVIVSSIVSNYLPNHPSEGELDCHTHTYLSDAYSTPTDWVRQAYEEEGLIGMAITDHDMFPGQEAFEAVKILNDEIDNQNNMDHGTRLHFTLIPGIEITTLQDGVEVHVLLYLPDYYNDDFNLEEKTEVRGILSKLFDSEGKTIERIENIKKQINELYPHFSISEEDIGGVVRGPNIYASAVSDALWERYKDVYPEEFEKLGINNAKYVWYNLIAKKGLGKRSKEHEKLLPTVEDVLKLAANLNGRIAIAHPNEIIKQKEGAFEEILERLARYVIDKNISPSTILGIAYYSHKLRRSGLRGDIKNYVDLLNNDHPFFKKFNLLFIPESDAHGKFTLSSDPLVSSPLGLQSDYPENKAAYNKELLAAIYDKSFLPVSSAQLSQIQQGYKNWQYRRIKDLRRDTPNSGRGIDDSTPCKKLFLSKEAESFIARAI